MESRFKMIICFLDFNVTDHDSASLPCTPPAVSILQTSTFVLILVAVLQIFESKKYFHVKIVHLQEIISSDSSSTSIEASLRSDSVLVLKGRALRNHQKHATQSTMFLVPFGRFEKSFHWRFFNENTLVFFTRSSFSSSEHSEKFYRCLFFSPALELSS